MSTHTATAADLLDESHPYRRALGATAVMRRQAGALAAFLLLAAVLSHQSLRRAVPVELCGLVVGLVLGCGIAGQVAATRRLARELIIERGRADIAELVPERERLLGEENRERLAEQLLRTLRLAESFDRLAVASRPPPGVRPLARHADLVRSIAARLEQPRPSLRGVALVERLLDGGYAASIYHLDPVALEREIRRIRCQLSLCDTDV
jgi:hypothetical protein